MDTARGLRDQGDRHLVHHARQRQRIAYGSTLDGVYANGTGRSISRRLGPGPSYEHFWTPKLHTAVQGGIVGINYGQAATNLMCAGAPGFASNRTTRSEAASPRPRPAVTFINGWAPARCHPNFSWYQVGTRTIWNPHPDLDIGVEVLYTGLDTANSGATVNAGAASGAVPAGQYTFANTGVWTSVFRIQRKLPALILEIGTWFSDPRQRCRGFLFEPGPRPGCVAGMRGRKGNRSRNLVFRGSLDPAGPKASGEPEFRFAERACTQPRVEWWCSLPDAGAAAVGQSPHAPKPISPHVFEAL